VRPVVASKAPEIEPLTAWPLAKRGACDLKVTVTSTGKGNFVITLLATKGNVGTQNASIRVDCGQGVERSFFTDHNGFARLNEKVGEKGEKTAEMTFRLLDEGFGVDLVSIVRLESDSKFQVSSFASILFA
jgi:hypothetical protein